MLKKCRWNSPRPLLALRREPDETIRPWDWVGHPLTTSIISAVVGGLILAAILALLR